MSATRHSTPGQRTHLHQDYPYTMRYPVKFKTIALDKLPARSRFGKEPIFSDADVDAATTELDKGVAISDGETYATRGAAHNRAGVLRARLTKKNPTKKYASAAIEADGKYSWWISPVVSSDDAPAEGEPAPTA